jgi:hypothetical protein
MKKILLSFFIILLNTFVGAQSKLVTKWNPYTKSYETTYHEDIYEKRQREIEEEENEEKRRRQKSYEESEKSYNETLNNYIYSRNRIYEKTQKRVEVMNNLHENIKYLFDRILKCNDLNVTRESFLKNLKTFTEAQNIMEDIRYTSNENFVNIYEYTKKFLEYMKDIKCKD